MITIITEHSRVSIAIAKTFNVTQSSLKNIYLSDDLSVIMVPKDYLSARKLNFAMLGELPYIPASYHLRQKRGKSQRGFDNKVREIILSSDEIVFASNEGAIAQARFDNLCRHFNVGQKTSRMWLNALTPNSVVHSFEKRESGRHLHSLAQTGLVTMAMDSAFEYNFNNAMRFSGFSDIDLSRKEVIALDFLRSIDENVDESFRKNPEFRICLNGGTGEE